MAEVKRLDTGDGDILMSGESREDVEAALHDLVSRGARIITPVSQIGRRWIAACSPAPKVEAIDQTSTLDLREVQAAQRRRRPEAALCQVEEAGLKRIVTGPTHEAVHAKLAELLEGGATLVSSPEESFGSWIAVCDTGPDLKPK